ncbi:MAG: FGGY family carbohydrate kinase [Spirochaetaceae bacterium]|nr:FGGY family carbohydrate kinase [Spirochaetaceae bacterium]
MYFIAVDAGSSYVKTAVFDIENSRIIETAKYASPGRRANPDSRVFEINAGELFNTVKDSIDSFCGRYTEVAGILFSTQMHGCVLAAPGVMDDVYISWQDSRCLNAMPAPAEPAGISYLEYLARVFPGEYMRPCGVEIKPALALCNVFTFLHQRDFQVPPGTELFTLGSYFIKRLTGNNVCHITNAAPLGMVDITRGAWREDIIRKAGFEKIKFPEITQDLAVCGTYRCGGRAVNVYPDIGDQQASVLGSMARPGDLVANIATGGQVILVDDEFYPGTYEIRPYFEGAFNNVVSRMPAGRNFEIPIEFIREIGEKVFGLAVTKEDIWARVREYLTLEDTQGMEGDISFYEVPHKLAEGKFGNINHYNFTLRNFFSSLVRDMAKIYARYIRVLCADRPFGGKLIFCGGMVRNNPVLMQAVEAETGLAGVLAGAEDEVYMGMLRLAMVCSGVSKNLRETEKMMKPNKHE